MGRDARRVKTIRDDYEIAAICEGLERDLEAQVRGQSVPIATFVRGIHEALSFEVLKRKTSTSMSARKYQEPLGVFLLAGPSGVGKTLLAQTAAERLGQLGFESRRFDMSGYANQEADNYLTGFSSTYANSQPGELTHYVKEHQRSVLIFDEVEKASQKVKQLFLQIIEEGVLHDNYTQEDVPFGRTILVFTTNAGRSAYENETRSDLSSLPTRVIVDALSKEASSDSDSSAGTIPPALVSRLASGTIVMFNRLCAHDLLEVIRSTCEEESDAFQVTSGLRISVDDNVPAAILFGSGGLEDCRTVRGNAKSFLEDMKNRMVDAWVARHPEGDGAARPTQLDVTVQLDGADPQVQALFRPIPKARVLCCMPKDVFDDISGRAERAGMGVSFVRPDAGVGGEGPWEWVASWVKAAGDFDLALVDVAYWKDEGGSARSTSYLGITDVDTRGRRVLQHLRKEHPDCPVYVLRPRRNWHWLDDADRRSLMAAGARGFLDQQSTGFLDGLADAVDALSQERQVLQLTRSHKVLRYHTQLPVPDEGGSQAIRLCDLSLEPSRDSEDADKLMSPLEIPTDDFEDIVGNEGAKKVLRIASACLKDPRRFRQESVRMPRGILLYGAPGTGKTMLSRAMAHDADAEFIPTSGSELRNGGSQRIKELFALARKYAPSIVFIDEIDPIVLPRERSGVPQLTEALLTQMDGFDQGAGRPVLVLAATNFAPEGFDAAAMRRFDYKVHVDVPSDDERRELIRASIRKSPVLSGITDAGVEYLVKQTAGKGYAPIVTLLNRAALGALSSEPSQVVDDEMLREVYEQDAFGETHEIDDARRLSTARHECGHALVAYLSGIAPESITVVARESYEGLTSLDLDGVAVSRAYLMAMVRMQLAGRAAEVVYYGEGKGLNAGARSDLQKATQLLRQGLCSFGLDRQFGMAVQDGNASLRANDAVSAYLEAALKDAIQAVEDHRDAIDELVGILMDTRYASRETIGEVFSRHGIAFTPWGSRP